MKTFYNVYAICGFAAIGGGLFGFDISSMSGVLGTQAYKNYFDNPVSYRQGGITASMPAGSFFGALASSFIADRFSRRAAIQIASVIWIIGSILQAASNGIPLLCVGRVISGVSIGICSTIVPVYQSEIAPKNIRGRVVSFQQWAITWGILIQYFIQYGASHVDGGATNPTQGTAAFRIPWGIQAVPGAILLIGLFFFPRSPRWLASKDRWDEALLVLANLHAKGDINDPKVLAEYKEIEEALRFEREEATNSFQALVQPRMLKRVILGMSIQMWSQLSGMNIMMYYIVYIMEASGLGNPLLTASIQYILNVALTLPAILYLDKWGRRPALLLGSFGMMVWLFISGSVQGVYGKPNPGTDPTLSDISWVLADNPAASRAVVAASYLFVCTFATTWGPVSWTYPSEIFPSKVRAKAVSLATASNWAWNCALAFGVPPLLWNINWKMYMIFAAFNGAAFIHMFLTAPETKGKTLEEMDEVFDSGRPAWRSAPKESRLERLQNEIEKGNVKVTVPSKIGTTEVVEEKTN
ncbi:MFS sugar transporter-like protein [Eremomyces bilateralis CBS 781.70]|uniref:MFS sugar transporter-like protein n=1 Tax=Eremomyces bilateralis CBS 781.70 TaxID=1392243 RepID=A0A6G1G4P7_9PEZI|nr:MFS sugar transporter-like protein [Eremomyces bilateralis CBS 781.70]KAF1813047.1 MFS sugar transporter-like protein [Eremomyces bilateralis CBS 781.70]